MKTNSSNHNQFIARGTRISECKHNHDCAGDEIISTVGFINIEIYNPNTRTWTPLSKDPDKFIITTSVEPSIAWTEFYARWKHYINKHFPGLTYCKIESINNI